MAKSKWNQDAAIRGGLRRVFSRSPVVREVLLKVRRTVPKYNKDGSRAKRDAVEYKCNVCGEWVGSKHIAVDHIVPVIDVDEGFIDYQTFIERLFCGVDNLQPICTPCHKAKTYSERIARYIKQYTEEIDTIEEKVKDKTLSKKEALDLLKKYISKKKIDGLKDIADRAQKLKTKYSPSKPIKK